MRLETFLAGHARRRPDHEAVVCGAHRITYSALHTSIQVAACGLHRLGVRQGDRVLLFLQNGVEFVQLLFAAIELGAIAVPVNTRLSADELQHVIGDCTPAVVVYGAGSRDTVRPGLSHLAHCRALVLGEPQRGEISVEQMLAGPAAVLPDLISSSAEGADDCLIMYTSGTTGKAKGAVVTHANLMIQCAYMYGYQWDVGEDDRYLVTTPLAHRTGISRLVSALGLGGTLVVMERFDPGQALDVIATERITVAGMVPTILRMLLPQLRKHPEKCSSLRRLIVAAEAFPVPLKQEIMALLPHVKIHCPYGLTEAAVTNLGHAEQISHPESVGRPLPGIEVRIVDDAGCNVDEGAVGELLVRSGMPGRDAVFRGYYNRPDETAAAFRNGWFHTGDLARRDTEGFLYIVDRKKDMVLSGGFNIYSKEVEHALASHPDIADAAVIGVPDETFGEAVAAFVETRGDARLTAGQVIDHCRSRLASYKKPKHVYFVDALPRNAVGKVLKNELREMAAKTIDLVKA
jgi:long-chain acyl-CoA synthetase